MVNVDDESEDVLVVTEDGKSKHKDVWVLHLGIHTTCPNMDGFSMHKSIECGAIFIGNNVTIIFMVVA